MTIEINSGFTSIRAGTDPVAPPGARQPTGARVTLEFCREAALAPGQAVCARYEFAGDGRVRTATGVAKPTHVVVRPGRATLFHYRLSHWIKPEALI